MYSRENIEAADTVYMVMTDRFFDGDPSNNGTPGAEYQPGNLHFYQGEDHRAAVGRETHIFPSFW